MALNYVKDLVDSSIYDKKIIKIDDRSLSLFELKPEHINMLIILQEGLKSTKDGSDNAHPNFMDEIIKIDQEDYSFRTKLATILKTSLEYLDEINKYSYQKEEDYEQLQYVFDTIENEVKPDSKSPRVKASTKLDSGNKLDLIKMLSNSYRARNILKLYKDLDDLGLVKLEDEKSLTSKKPFTQIVSEATNSIVQLKDASQFLPVSFQEEIKPEEIDPNNPFAKAAEKFKES